MVLISSVLVVSFCLEGFLSNVIGMSTSFFIPLFSIVSLLIIYPYFNHEEQSFLTCCFALGLCYDLVYTDTLIVNACLFTIVGLFIKWLNSWLSNHAISLVFMTTLTIIFYRVLMYSILVVVGYLPFDFHDIIISLSSSLVLNIIYVEILYFITDQMSHKYHIRKID